jgi:hypothetical protein
MLGTARLSDGSDRVELGFVERESTPEPAMKLGIRLHLAGLSLSNTISILERLGVERCRSTVHNWVQKADLQPTDGADSDHVAVDETVIQLNDKRYWLHAAVDPETNRLLHVKLSRTRNQASLLGKRPHWTISTASKQGLEAAFSNDTSALMLPTMKPWPDCFNNRVLSLSRSVPD